MTWVESAIDICKLLASAGIGSYLTTKVTRRGEVKRANCSAVSEQCAQLKREVSELTELVVVYYRLGGVHEDHVKTEAVLVSRMRKLKVLAHDIWVKYGTIERPRSKEAERLRAAALDFKRAATETPFGGDFEPQPHDSETVRRVLDASESLQQSVSATAEIARRI
ncbi:MAG: hypothetical protein DWP92_11180 [Armatimonadetes bacterium]|nr:MAG: hypothetical protein DWP92_11180 [Armatimonadota bacterium]